jgi:hypothetical protein
VQEQLLDNEVQVVFADQHDALSELSHVVDEKGEGLAGVRQRIDKLKDPDPDGS